MSNGLRASSEPFVRTAAVGVTERQMPKRAPVTNPARSMIIGKHPREESTGPDCVSQRFKNSKPHFHTAAAPALNGQADSGAAEASVRQLIANGKSKVALDGAKEIHKAQGTA